MREIEEVLFFSHRLVDRWNALDKHTVDATSSLTMPLMGD